MDVLARLRAAGLVTDKSPVELTLMRGLKRMLDPTGLMNPGKVLPGR